MDAKIASQENRPAYRDIDQMIHRSKKEANPLYPVPVVRSRKDFKRLIESIRK